MMKSKNLLPVIALIAITFFIYAFNLNNPLFWDDDEWIKSNVFVHSFSYLKEVFTQNIEAGFGLSSNYFRPLLLLSFAFNYVIHGIQPFGYHLLSNGIHIANGILIFLLLSRFLTSRASFIASLLFLIHPVQTEAVTYISGRGDPMSVFFMLLALWFFVRSLNIEISKYRNSYFILSLISTILAILSRETAILFPLFLMIFYISFLSKEKFAAALKKSFVVSMPFWVISIVYFILRLTVFNFENTLNFYSQPNVYSENLFIRLYTFGAVLVEYFKIIFLPVGLHMERDFSIFTSLLQWPVWLALVIVLLIFYFYFSKFKFQVPRIWFFSWAWFFVSLGPVSGIIPINALIYEHWLYLPLIGFAALAGFYLDIFFEFLNSRKLVIGHWSLVIFLVIYFSFFAVQSIRRNILWGKPIEFYEDILKYSPDSIRIITNLGNIYLERGNLAKAEELFIRAIKNPEGNRFAQPHYNLGNLFRDTGRLDEAIEQYEKAIKIDPNFPFAYQNLSVLLINNKKDLAGGAKVLEELKKIQPGNSRIYYNLGLIYLATNNIDLAIENFEKGLDLASGRDPEVEQAIKKILSRIK